MSWGSLLDGSIPYCNSVFQGGSVAPPISMGPPWSLLEGQPMEMALCLFYFYF